MNKLVIGIIMLGAMIISSCATKKIIYVKDMEPNIPYDIQSAKPLRIQKGDRISISVSSKNPELVIPFNEGIGSYQMNNQGTLETGINNNFSTKGYLVTQNGSIDFPILGNLEVLNMTLDEVKDNIQQLLINNKYINDPLVKVELLNLKINVMGEVNHVGIINVPDGQINLMEALSRAGGINRNAATDRVSVIREENGIRKIIINDIESKDIFNSPTYYLQQNDIVYVAQKDPVTTPKQDVNLRYVSIGASVLSVLLSIINLTK